MTVKNFIDVVLKGATFVFLIFFLLFFASKLTDDGKTEEEILKSNKKEESETELTVVTFGVRPFYDDVYFIQNEGLEEGKLDEIIEKYRYFLFDEKRFIEFSKSGLVEELLSKGKTVLFHDTSGEGLDVSKIIDESEIGIPVHYVEHDKELFITMYGYGYSKNYNATVPIVVLTNTMTGGDKDREKMLYLIEHEVEHWGTLEDIEKLKEQRNEEVLEDEIKNDAKEE